MFLIAGELDRMLRCAADLLLDIASRLWGLALAYVWWVAVVLILQGPGAASEACFAAAPQSVFAGLDGRSRYHLRCSISTNSGQELH